MSVIAHDGKVVVAGGKSLSFDNLISIANETTGQSDTTLTDAIQSLVDGYGGGDEPVLIKEITLASDTDVIEIGGLNLSEHFSVTISAAGANAGNGIRVAYNGSNYVAGYTGGWNVEGRPTNILFARSDNGRDIGWSCLVRMSNFGFNGLSMPSATPVVPITTLSIKGGYDNKTFQAGTVIKLYTGMVGFS